MIVSEIPGVPTDFITNFSPGDCSVTFSDMSSGTISLAILISARIPPKDVLVLLVGFLMAIF